MNKLDETGDMNSLEIKECFELICMEKYIERNVWRGNIPLALKGADNVA